MTTDEIHVTYTKRDIYEAFSFRSRLRPLSVLLYPSLLVWYVYYLFSAPSVYNELFVLAGVPVVFFALTNLWRLKWAKYSELSIRLMIDGDSLRVKDGDICVECAKPTKFISNGNVLLLSIEEYGLVVIPHRYCSKDIYKLLSGKS